MKLAEVVGRARKCIGHECEYALGKGGFVPYSDWPWDETKRLDCSGFAMWCCLLSRHQGDEWINTDAMVVDGKIPGGLFDAVEWDAGKPGNLIVYPRGKGVYGHVGIITVLDEDGLPSRAVHCSSGNQRRTGDAIQETGVGVWGIRKDSLIVRCNSVDETA